MSENPPDNPRSAAIDQLEQLGLSTYAARTLVALVALDSGAAKDVSEVADIPRTRVYDAVEELQEEGLVDIQQSTPKQFWPVSTETLGRSFERTYQSRLAQLKTALDTLDTAPRRTEQEGVWTVTSQEAITDRITEFFASAEDEIVYMTVEDLLTDEIVDALAAASERGIAIRLAGISPTVQARLQDAIPGAEMFESLWVWSDTPAGRLLMIDGTKTLVSVHNNESELASAEQSETAIWGAGETNSLVVVLRAIFTWRLSQTDENSTS